MKTHFIISMGTSILSNYRRVSHQKAPAIYFPTLLCTGTRSEKGSFPTPRIFCKAYVEICKILSSQEAKGAEQTSIEHLKKERDLKNSDCRYHIKATDTKECLFCASFLEHEVLKDQVVDFYFPTDLGSAGHERFSERGLPNLLSWVTGILDKVDREGDEVVITPTSGYKIMVPYLTIASILYKRPAYEKGVEKSHLRPLASTFLTHI